MSMNTASITIKTDSQIKAQAQQVAKQLGVSLNAVLTDLLKQFIKTKAITGKAPTDEIPNAYFKKMVKKARADRLAGKASPIFTDDEKLIKNDPKKYQHVDTMTQWLHGQGV